MRSPATKLTDAISKRLGLPVAAPLRRYEPGQPLLAGPALLVDAPGGRLVSAVDGVLEAAGTLVLREAPAAEGARLAALVFDATGIGSSVELRALYDVFHPVIRRVDACGRVLVLGTPPASCAGAAERTAQRALEGFVRSVAKEVGRGATAQLVQVERGAEGNVESTLRFLLSAKSAYVSGQVVRVGEGVVTVPEDWERPLAGRTAVVTGASRGIGAAIARTLARDGAHVVCLDVPAQGAALAAVANAIGGTTLQLDVTADDAPTTLARHLRERHGGVDVVVHNAGVTRDKTLGRMDEERWDVLMAVNLSAPERLNEALLGEDLLSADGRIVGVSSMAGIAGNRGQTNYATSKAGVIGMVDALAAELAGSGRTINAVAPGFIETQMTQAMPFATREAGRRMNSLAQGGQPVDVAETIAWFASPASGGVNGNVIRVCGQSLLGA